MPNNTTIEMTVSGDTKLLKQFAAAHVIEIPEDEQNKFDDITQHFDFNTIVPMPVALQGTTSPTPNEAGAKMRAALLKEKYGYANWYDWSVANWGVKWNSYDGTFNLETGSGKIGGIQINFQTAWTIPEAIFLELMELYPELVFEVECLEEGGEFSGYICYEDGFADESELKYDMDSWREQATKMLGYEFDEDGDII